MSKFGIELAVNLLVSRAMGDVLTPVWKGWRALFSLESSPVSSFGLMKQSREFEISLGDGGPSPLIIHDNKHKQLASPVVSSLSGMGPVVNILLVEPNPEQAELI